MYKLKKIFALVMALVLATSFSTVAFAAEESGIPENATRHTIEVTVEPGETLEGTEEGIAPYIWNQGTYNPPANGATYTAQFTIPDRYFAYEMYATSTNGSNVNANYEISLLHAAAFSIIASSSKPINGTTYKLDWIDVNANQNYLFKISNYSSVPITVRITYYSWA